MGSKGLEIWDYYKDLSLKTVLSDSEFPNISEEARIGPSSIRDDIERVIT